MVGTVAQGAYTGGRSSGGRAAAGTAAAALPCPPLRAATARFFSSYTQKNAGASKKAALLFGCAHLTPPPDNLRPGRTWKRTESA